MPKVSVIIPNYNHARYLSQRIESVLNQTYQDFEVLLLDDASTDESMDVLVGYADHPKVRLIANERNSGNPFKQWNRGVEEARGEYVWVAESDDFADVRFLERLAPLLDENPGVGVAYCQSWDVDGNGTIIRSRQQYTHNLDADQWRSDFIMSGREMVRSYMPVLNVIPNASAALFRKSIYQQAKSADEGMRYCGDWHSWVAMLLLADVAFVSEPLNYFREHQQTMRSRTTHTETGVLENLSVLQTVSSSVDIPRARHCAAIDRVQQKWRKLIKDEEAPKSVSGGVRIWWRMRALASGQRHQGLNSMAREHVSEAAWCGGPFSAAVRRGKMLKRLITSEGGAGRAWNEK